MMLHEQWMADCSLSHHSTLVNAPKYHRPRTITVLWLAVVCIHGSVIAQSTTSSMLLETQGCSFVLVLITDSDTHAPSCDLSCCFQIQPSQL